MKYSITSVSTAVRDYETKFGAMKSYKIMLDGGEVVELSQKASTPAPTVGQELEGHIEEGQYGKKFKKEFQQGGFSKPSVHSTTETKFSTSSESPEKQESIQRMNALTNAVNYCKSDTPIEQVLVVAEDFNTFLKGVEVKETPKLDPLPEDEPPIEAFEDEVDLEDIPF